MRTLFLITPLTLIGLAAACSTSDAGPQTTPGTGGTCDVRAALAAGRCTSCHAPPSPAGRLDLTQVHVDLTRTLRQVLQDAMPLAAARGLDLRIAPNTTRVKVIGDPERVHQILLNLVGNAIKFTEQGWVQVSIQPSTDTVDILVADSGIGISPEAQAEIFDEFFQVSHGVSRRYSGAGLGLAISKRLANQMGGEISVQSELGEGSVFTLRLPMAPPGYRDQPH